MGGRGAQAAGVEGGDVGAVGGQRDTARPPAERVSVCVAVYNGERFLREALESIRAQTHPVLEIVVCDDASTDATPHILNELANADPRIRVLRNERNLGGYGAMNRAVREARGELAAVYHADDVYDPTIVEREAAYLAAHPEAGAVFCLDRFIDVGGREYARLTLPRALVGRAVFDGPTLTDAMLRHKNTFLRTPSVMFRRSAFCALGGFDQERFGIAADVDLWLRLAAEYPIGLIHEHLYGYRHYTEQWSRAYDRLRVTPEIFFAVMDRHLSRPGVRSWASPEALTLYRIWQVKDEAERAANALVLGDRPRARALLNSSLVRPLLRSPRPLAVARVLALKTFVRLAAAAGGGALARAAVYFARFRRLPPRTLEGPSASAAQTLAPDTSVTPRNGQRAARAVGVFVDPFSVHFYGNALFDPHCKLNRDNCLRPWFRLRDRLAEHGLEVTTADYLLDGSRRAERNVYVSFGVRDHYRALAARDDVLMTAFYLIEVVAYAPEMYRAAADLGRHFRTVYSWADPDTLAPYAPGELRVAPFRIPAPFDSVLEPHWSRADRRGVVMVNANAQPVLRTPTDLLPERLRAIEHFARGNAFDLWGRRWDRLRPEDAHFEESVRKTWRGPSADKYETLARCRFAICYENVALQGYVSEKIFDCFYAGVVPVYLGAPDIDKYVPDDCFIDRRRFPSYDELERYLEALSPEDVQRYREAARDYFASERFRPFSAETFADRFIADIEAHLAERTVAERGGRAWD